MVHSGHRRPRLRHDEYTVAWICALHHELAAAIAMLDEQHADLPTQDDSHYVLGRIAHHNLVIATLPEGHYGTTRATRIAVDLCHAFPSVSRCLLVGIGGGFPIPPSQDIRLGDVVVGSKVTTHDEGKQTANGKLQRTGDSMRPSQDMLTALSVLRARQEAASTATNLCDIVLERLPCDANFHKPDAEDRLFPSDYLHASPERDCRGCSSESAIPRPARPLDRPEIHYGAIASGNTLIKNSEYRDKMAHDLDVICVEMEAAGLMNILPTLVIRGVSDYADSHKNDAYHKYAAANAAAFGRIYLELFKPTRGAGMGNPEFVKQTKHVQALSANSERREEALAALKFESMNSRQFSIKGRLKSTCQWLFEDETFTCWLDSERIQEHQGFLWLKGKPGAGKSTIMRYAYEQHRSRLVKDQLNAGSSTLLLCFFFHARGERLQKSVEGMYRSLVFQLLEGYPDLKAILDDPDLGLSSDTEVALLDQAQEIFDRGISRLGDRQVVCYVDALDECDAKEVLSMVRTFQDLADEYNRQTARFSVFFSSRHYPYIKPRLGLQLTLDYLPGHFQDMEKYVQSRLDYDDVGLQTKVLNKSRGVFIWLVLIIDILNEDYSNGQTTDKARKKLADFPEDLSALFLATLSRQKGSTNEFIDAVTWILFAKRPLSAVEFEHALWATATINDRHDAAPPITSTNEDISRIARRVTSVTKGLAEIVRSRKHPTVQFIHESVRDFLIKDGGLARIMGESADDVAFICHDRLKHICHYYLEMPEVEDAWISDAPVQPLKIFPLLRYSAQSIFYHAERAAALISQTDFVTDFETVSWIRSYNLYAGCNAHKYGVDTGILYVLAAGGHASLIRACPEKMCGCCMFTTQFGSPLLVAFYHGYTETVSALLELPRDMCQRPALLTGLTNSSKASDFYGCGHTLLSWAAKGYHVGLIRVLFQKGLAAVNDTDGRGYSPLARAILQEGGNEKSKVETVEMLLDEGANWEPNMAVCYPSDEPSLKVFESSAQRDYLIRLRHLVLSQRFRQQKDMMALLEDSFCADEGWLSPAARTGHMGLVRLLVEKGADVNAAPSWRLTWNIGDHLPPLREALDHGHHEVADFLAKNGAKVQEPQV